MSTRIGSVINIRIVRGVELLYIYTQTRCNTQYQKECGEYCGFIPETIALPEKQNNGGRPQNNNKSDYDCLKAIAE